MEETFASRLANLLTRQEKELKAENAAASLKVKGASSLKDILGSNEYWDRFSWLKKEEKYGKK